MTGLSAIEKIAVLAEEIAESPTPGQATATSAGIPFHWFIIGGSVIVLVIAIFLAIRSANKKYGKGW